MNPSNLGLYRPTDNTPVTAFSPRPPVCISCVGKTANLQPVAITLLLNSKYFNDTSRSALADPDITDALKSEAMKSDWVVIQITFYKAILQNRLDGSTSYIAHELMGQCQIHGQIRLDNTSIAYLKSGSCIGIYS